MLLTKFYLPELRPNRVNRPRLLERLSPAVPCSLVILSAPAGFGKTTLISEWAHSAGERVAWVSCDSGDNDPVQFWASLVTALDTLFPGVEENCRGMLSARQPLPAQIFLTALLNDLTLRAGAEGTPPRACLVLDDIHLVTNAEIYEALLFFIERLPPNLRLALIGRSDPPLPLGRLRAGGKMLEVRAADLRFTLEECEDFLNRVMGFALEKGQVKQLEERTEGWAAGLQLAGLAMQGLTQEAGPSPGGGEGPARGDLADFIENFSGEDRFILDYLLEEVLDRQPQEARDFLLQTSILDRMCGPLCDAVTGRAAGQSQAVLESFERGNLFLIHLDNRRTWYRYHHLFAELLRRQLERQGQQAAAGLHRRAAEWFAGQGLLQEAIGHALQGQDFEQAADWLETCARGSIDRGEYATFKRLAESLPEAVLYRRPELLMHYAWVLAYLGDVELYEKPLAAAEQLWRDQGELARLGVALNLRADFALTYGDGEKAFELAQQALDLLPEEDLHQRGMSLIYLGGAALLQGDIEKARETYRVARETCQRGGSTTGTRMATNALAQVLYLQGNLPGAAAVLEENLSEMGKLPIYEGLAGRALLGAILREWNRAEEAEQALQSVLEVVEHTNQMIYFHTLYLNLALIYWERGDTAGMQGFLEEHEHLAEQADCSMLSTNHAIRAQIAALSGDLEPALAWRDSLSLSVNDAITFQNEYFYLALAGLLVRLDEQEARQGLALLQKLRGHAQAQRRTASLCEIGVKTAVGLARISDIEGALAALEETLALACPGKYARVFLDEGQPLLKLLARLTRQPHLSAEIRAYALQLLEQAPGASASAQAANQSRIEPLTPREMEVLRLIQAGLSNQAIAEQLYLTLNTVKVHIKNIFAKLEVENRTQAVRKAEEFGILQ